MSKDGEPAQNNSTTTKAPWSGAIPYLNQGLEGSRNLYQSGGAQYYPGQTYAGANPAFTSAISNLNNTGNAAATARPQDNPAYSYFSGVANGDYLKAGNPYFQQMSDTIKGQVQPGIVSPFAGAGRGNSGLASRALGLGLGDAIGSLAYGNYNTERGRQGEAAGALSNIYDNNLKNQIAGGNAQLLAGTTQQGLEQGYLSDAQRRWDAQQQQPMLNLQNFLRNITGQVQGTGQTTSTGTATPAQPSFWNQLGSGALAAASFFA